MIEGRRVQGGAFSVEENEGHIQSSVPLFRQPPLHAMYICSYHDSKPSPAVGGLTGHIRQGNCYLHAV